MQRGFKLNNIYIDGLIDRRKRIIYLNRSIDIMYFKNMEGAQLLKNLKNDNVKSISIVRIEELMNKFLGEERALVLYELLYSIKFKKRELQRIKG